MTLPELLKAIDLVQQLFGKFPDLIEARERAAEITKYVRIVAKNSAKVVKLCHAIERIVPDGAGGPTGEDIYGSGNWCLACRDEGWVFYESELEMTLDEGTSEYFIASLIAELPDLLKAIAEAVKDYAGDHDRLISKIRNALG